MIIAIIYLLISFLLDGIISNYIPFSLTDISYFKTIFTIVALVVIYNYFDNKQKYIYIIIALGALFDIVYTNTFILNIILFLIIYLILDKLDYILPNNILTINLKSLISISSYYVLTYVILLLSHYNKYDISLLYTILLKNIISTVIYTTVSSIILKIIYNKMDSKLIK